MFARVSPGVTRQIVTNEEPVEVLCLGGVPGGAYPGVVAIFSRGLSIPPGLACRRGRTANDDRGDDVRDMVTTWETELPGTPEQVWDAITVHSEAWLWPIAYEPREGGAESGLSQRRAAS